MIGADTGKFERNKFQERQGREARRQERQGKPQEQGGKEEQEVKEQDKEAEVAPISTSPSPEK